MSSNFLIFTLVCSFLFSFPHAFGTVDSFTTDKSVYLIDDTLNISGIVSFDPEIQFVTIQIFHPDKSNFADFNTIPVNSDGTFSTNFHVGGPTWPSDGHYHIKVTYDGSLEKSIAFKKNSESLSDSTPEEQIPSTPEEQIVSDVESDFTTLKLKILNFPSIDKSPQYYIDRYNNEPDYKSWFDSQFPSNSIYDVVGYKSTHANNFPSIDKSPQYYIDRYNNEPDYKSWFDSQFSKSSIYNVLGYSDPLSLPDWIRNNAEWWATGQIPDSTFVTGIEFMIQNEIITISNIPSSKTTSSNEIPDWIRNSAHWWSQDLISEDEFVNSLEFLIKDGIIIIN